jgi:chromosome segregation ATPase
MSDSNSAAAASAPKSDSTANMDANASVELQKLHRRVSNLTFEKADLQSLLDKKNAQAEARQKSFELLETQLQSTIAENDRLAREAEYAKMRESQSHSDKSSREVSLEIQLGQLNSQREAMELELQHAKETLSQQSSMNSALQGALSASDAALSQARADFESLRSTTQADAGQSDELKKANASVARLTEDNKLIKCASPCMLLFCSFQSKVQAPVLQTNQSDVFVAALLDQAVVAQQTAQGSFSASASEAKAQQDMLNIELRSLQQRLESETALRAKVQQQANDYQHRIEELVASSMLLQKQVPSAAKSLAHMHCNARRSWTRHKTTRAICKTRFVARIRPALRTDRKGRCFR